MRPPTVETQLLDLHIIKCEWFKGEVMLSLFYFKMPTQTSRSTSQ